jgi:hypothetical protein
MVRMHLSTALNDELYSIGCRRAKRDIARDSIADLRRRHFNHPYTREIERSRCDRVRVKVSKETGL